MLRGEKHMKDFYFIAGIGIGALVGMAVMYKSKTAKEVACECEKGINNVAENVKKTLTPKKSKKEKQQEK